MAQLRQDYSKFIQNHTEVIVVGPESAGLFEDYWKQNNLPYIGIPDPTHSVLKRYGQEVNLFKLGRMPAQVVVDRQGIARFVHYGKSMSDIPDNQDLLQMLASINEEAVKYLM